MNRWLLIVLLAGSVSMRSASAFEERSAVALQFQQIGPADASIAPFKVEIGSASSRDGSILFVSAETFDKVLTLVKRVSGPVRDPCPPGSLHVIYFQSGKESATYTIYPEAMLGMVVQLMHILADLPRA